MPPVVSNFFAVGPRCIPARRIEGYGWSGGDATEKFRWGLQVTRQLSLEIRRRFLNSARILA